MFVRMNYLLNFNTYFPIYIKRLNDETFGLFLCIKINTDTYGKKKEISQ